MMQIFPIPGDRQKVYAAFSTRLQSGLVVETQVAHPSLVSYLVFECGAGSKLDIVLHEHMRLLDLPDVVCANWCALRLKLTPVLRALYIVNNKPL